MCPDPVGYAASSKAARASGQAHGNDFEASLWIGLVRTIHPSHDAGQNRIVTDKPIKKVWIEEGCISCKLCEDIAPQVFEVADDQDCIVKPDAAAHFGPLAEDIE